MSDEEHRMDTWPGCAASISYGQPFTTTCAKHVDSTFHAKRIYIIASGSLSRNTNHVTDLCTALGDTVVGIRKGMTPHTLWSEVLSITNEAASLHVDLIITLGAGSLTDAAKLIALALANDAFDTTSLATLGSGGDFHAERPELKAPTVPIISIPTSLSGGEYTNIGGGTSDDTHHKHLFGPPSRGPALVILDPALTITTPDEIWLSTGIRAVDHCVESMCSLSSTEESVADAADGLRLLIAGLLRCKSDREDLEARHMCQMGTVRAVKSVFYYRIPLGASHGIGHQLGPVGVGHGETSCILLPAVCKYNAGVNGKQQDKARQILWGEDVVKEVLERKGLSEQTADLGDMLDTVIRELGLPRTLKEKGVGKDKLDMLAENSLKDPCCTTNPIPLKDKGQVLEILRTVAG